jgi:tetratricopeptide (TPR) repeat protein
VAPELVGALDDWILERRKRRAPEASWRKLLAVAQQADPDPWRRKVRRALADGDRATLTKLAATDAAAQAAVSVQLLGAALQEVGEKDLAVQWLRRGQRHHPGDVWLNYALAEVLRKGPPPQRVEAIGFYRAARALRPEIGHNLAHALLDVGQTEEALTIFRELIRLRPDNPDHRHCLGSALTRNGDLDEAIALLREALRLKSPFPEAHVSLGTALLDRGDGDAALKEYQEALRLRENYPEAHMGLGAFRARKGELEAAITSFKQALLLKKDYPDAHLNLALALAKKGDLVGALKECQETLRLNPDDPMAHVGLGTVRAKRGELDAAIAAFEAAVRLKKNFAEAHYNLGNALGKKGDLDRSIAAFEEALRLRKDYPEAHHNLGNALVGKGAYEAAIREFQEALRLQKDNPQAEYNLGLALRQQGRFAEARLAFRRAAALFAASRPADARRAALGADNCEQLIALEKRLPDLLSGEEQPRDNAERLALAHLCLRKRLTVSASRLFTEAFAADARLAESLPAQHRRNAACMAALAGCGKGEDAAGLDAKERARWRQQALDWLRADLRLWARMLDKDSPPARALLQRTLLLWQQHVDLAGVRDEEALTALPEPEQKAWRQFWTDVNTLLQKAQGKP